MSGKALTLGAQVQSSRGTNVKTLFFQVPMLEFWHGAGASVLCTLAHNLGTRSLCAHIFFKFWAATALFSVVSSCFKMASDRVKWSN